MQNKKLADEVLSKYYQAVAEKIEKNPEFIQMCQIEMAKALNDYPLSVAEYIQKNKLVSFNALEYIGVVQDYEQQ